MTILPDNRLNLAWVQNLPDDKKKDFEATVRNSTAALGRLRQILEQRLESIEALELKDDFYSMPEVSHRQTFNSGKKAEIQNILKLLSFF